MLVVLVQHKVTRVNIWRTSVLLTVYGEAQIKSKIRQGGRHIFYTKEGLLYQ